MLAYFSLVLGFLSKNVGVFQRPVYKRRLSRAAWYNTTVIFDPQPKDCSCLKETVLGLYKGFEGLGQLGEGKNEWASSRLEQLGLSLKCVQIKLRLCKPLEASWVLMLSRHRKRRWLSKYREVTLPRGRACFKKANLKLTRIFLSILFSFLAI